MCGLNQIGSERIQALWSFPKRRYPRCNVIIKLKRKEIPEKWRKDEHGGSREAGERCSGARTHKHPGSQPATFQGTRALRPPSKHPGAFYGTKATCPSGPPTGYFSHRWRFFANTWWQCHTRNTLDTLDSRKRKKDELSRNPDAGLLLFTFVCNFYLRKIPTKCKMAFLAQRKRRKQSGWCVSSCPLWPALCASCSELQNWGCRLLLPASSSSLYTNTGCILRFLGFQESYKKNKGCQTRLRRQLTFLDI